MPGKVLLNGRDIRQYDRRDYYRLFSAVFQAAPASYNTCSVPHRAPHSGLPGRAAFHGFPPPQSSKLERSVYEDAVALSGGETQRLMLARALYKEGQQLFRVLFLAVFLIFTIFHCLFSLL